MSPMRQIPPRDLEDLSAYIDGQLPPSRTASLVRRLEQDEALRIALEDMRQTVQALKSLPSRPVPRSFTLDPSAAARPAPTRWYPVLQLGTALAGVAFLLVVGLDAWSARPFGLASRLAPAEAPMALPEAGAESLFAAAGTATPAATALPSASDMLTAQATASPLPQPSPQEVLPPALGEGKASPTATASPTEAALTLVTRASSEAPVGLSWQRVMEIALGLLTVALAAFTLRMRRRTVP